MENVEINILKFLNKAFSGFFKKSYKAKQNINSNREFVSKHIYEKLSNDQPFVVSRLGGTELWALRNYLHIQKSSRSKVEFIFGKDYQWWWDSKMFSQMSNWSGFFPSTPESIMEFAKLYLNDLYQIDVLGWYDQSLEIIDEYLDMNIMRVAPYCLEPHGLEYPWTKALKGKNILVVHPFEQSINSQYTKRQFLFNSPDFLPEFNLKTIKAVQSLGGCSTKFESWFHALNYMKSQIDDVEYDICLIGCGAYGLPLAAHIKRKGKKAIHLGGSTQLLFGIKGRRWDNTNLYNQYWVRPHADETPDIAPNVENSCYW